MIIQNVLIGGFSFNRNALGGGVLPDQGYSECGEGGGVTPMWREAVLARVPNHDRREESHVGARGGGVHIKSHFISKINYCTCLYQEYTSAKPCICHGR